jgi:hypothetical protein
MTNPPRRSKRQLYLGFFFVSLAILVALARTFLGSSPTGTHDAAHAPQHIGITTDEAMSRLGEPTSRAEFYPDEAFNPERSALVERLRAEGREVPPVFLELAWFGETEILTIRFPAALDEAGQATPIGPSLGATRQLRPTDATPDGQ